MFFFFIDYGTNFMNDGADSVEIERDGYEQSQENVDDIGNRGVVKIEKGIYGKGNENKSKNLWIEFNLYGFIEVVEAVETDEGVGENGRNNGSPDADNVNKGKVDGEIEDGSGKGGFGDFFGLFQSDIDGAEHADDDVEERADDEDGNKDIGFGEVFADEEVKDEGQKGNNIHTERTKEFNNSIGSGGNILSGVFVVGMGRDGFHPRHIKDVPESNNDGRDFGGGGVDTVGGISEKSEDEGAIGNVDDPITDVVGNHGDREF